MFQYREYDETFYATDKLPSGKTIKIEFNDDTWGDRTCYNVYLVVSNKRKQENNTYMKTYSSDGISALVWARKKMLEFEEFITDVMPGEPVFIYCSWDDNRRRDAYHYGLKKYGYDYHMHDGKKVLGKVIIKEEVCE